MTSLEEKIQSSFNNEYHKLTVSIVYTHGRLVSVMNEALKPYGLTLQQFNFLRILRGQRPAAATVSLLQERMLDAKSDVSRLAERLRLKGFVERRTSKNDRRQAVISITKKGLETLDRIGDFDDVLRTIAVGVSTSEAGIVTDVLDRLVNALEE